MHTDIKVLTSDHKKIGHFFLKTPDGLLSSHYLSDADISWLEDMYSLTSGTLYWARPSQISDTRLAISQLHSLTPAPSPNLLHRRSITGEMLTWEEPQSLGLQRLDVEAKTTKDVKLLDEMGSPKGIMEFLPTFVELAPL
eukprot:CAMPEP_0119310102 /NCGR_PEP_ID=MMETSP1333-20130426/17700_1 /TAXON_ID=418940 /ORGANISM="Scyphosphaera apsteinii, Strain RCC1455" /LENGTH=139 /DNA_ID=CAMNT_0007314219 /DNA_START=80 /DNA_END=499 /DNA_ORIENTATION=-